MDTTPKSFGPRIAASTNVNNAENARSPQLAEYAHLTALRNDRCCVILIDVNSDFEGRCGLELEDFSVGARSARLGVYRCD
jgi:hypothetical protein